MATSDMFLWDDELEKLAHQALVIHSEATILAATDRTIHQLVSNGIEPVSTAAIKAALKAGLRRLVRPNLKAVWQLRNSLGGVLSCGIRNDSEAGEGWRVLIFEDSEPLFARRCRNEEQACDVAEPFRQDNIRGGWTEMKGGA